MIKFTPLQQAHIMSCARKHHKRGKSATNVELARDMGLGTERVELEALVMGLGLHVGDKVTPLKSMELHLERIKSN